MVDQDVTASAKDERGRRFRRHKYLDYQGYAFPWYATVLWISFVIGGLIYFVKHVLLE